MSAPGRAPSDDFLKYLGKAVDAHVGAHIFEQCLCGALQNTTRLLVTNQLHFLAHPEVEEILVLDRGVVAEKGTHAALSSTPGSRYRQMLASLEGETKRTEESKQTEEVNKRKGSKRDTRAARSPEAT